jgi:GNAT superfamily N-acetyltransferase
MSVVVRAVAGRSDVEATQRFASRVWPAGWHPGGLGWAMARGELADDVVIAVDEATTDVVGWAGRGGHDAEELQAQVDPQRVDAAALLVEWMLSDSSAHRQLAVWDGADALVAAVTAAGLTPAARDDWQGLFLDATRAHEDPRRNVEGYTLREVGDSDEELVARVAVHRAAWKPSTLPYIDGRYQDPTAESSFTADVYDVVRATWLYDRDLDLVAVADDGEFAACCIGWFDPATGTTEIEPMGVAPGHRRRGLAVGLCLEVAIRTARRGGTEVYINGSPNPAYPANTSAYLKAGFELRERATTYVRD